MRQTPPPAAPNASAPRRRVHSPAWHENAALPRGASSSPLEGEVENYGHAKDWRYADAEPSELLDLGDPGGLALLDERADALARLAGERGGKGVRGGIEHRAERLAHRGSHQLLGLGDGLRSAAQHLIDGGGPARQQVRRAVGDLVHQADALRIRGA